MGLKNAGEGGGGGEVEFFGAFPFCGEFSSGDSGHGEGGVGGGEVGGLGEFSKKKRFFGALRTTESHQRIGGREMLAEDGGGLLVKQAYCFSVEKGGASEVNLFPQSGKGGVGVEGGGGQFGRHAVSVSESIPGRRG